MNKEMEQALRRTTFLKINSKYWPVQCDLPCNRVSLQIDVQCKMSFVARNFRFKTVHKLEIEIL